MDRKKIEKLKIAMIQVYQFDYYIADMNFCHSFTDLAPNFWHFSGGSFFSVYCIPATPCHHQLGSHHRKRHLANLETSGIGMVLLIPGGSSLVSSSILYLLVG